jgi:hypothetical protein
MPGPVEIQDAFDRMIFCDVHLIIWQCRAEWSKSLRLMECIQFGCDILDNAYKGNAEWFKGGLFHKIF